MNLHDLLAISVRRGPHATAIQYVDDQRREEWTYAQLDHEATQIGGRSPALGSRQGRPRCILPDELPEFMAAYLGVIRLGAIPVPINTRYRTREIGHILTDCTPRLIISEAALMPILRQCDGLGVAGGVCDPIEQLDPWKGDTSTLVAARDRRRRPGAHPLHVRNNRAQQRRHVKPQQPDGDDHGPADGLGLGAQ